MQTHSFNFTLLILFTNVNVINTYKRVSIVKEMAN